MLTRVLTGVGGGGGGLEVAGKEGTHRIECQQ